MKRVVEVTERPEREDNQSETMAKWIEWAKRRDFHMKEGEKRLADEVGWPKASSVLRTR
jgi:hypothetical protein